MELIIYSVQAIHIVVSILLIVVVLLQPGKGGDLGSVFGGGGGSSESVFGAAGAVPFLSKVTRVLAVLFLLSSLTLGYFAAKNVNTSVVTDIPTTQQTTDIASPTDTSQQEPIPPDNSGQDQGSAAQEPAQQEQQPAEQSSGSELSDGAAEQPAPEANQEPSGENTEDTQ
ncbi:MAG: preprotein translocase subunit SecG [Thermodesulfobacteriota bacterium]